MRTKAIIALLVVGIIFVFGYLQATRNGEGATYELTIAFPHAGGTVVGSPVMFKGKRIGSVVKLLPQRDGSIHIQVAINAHAVVSRSHIPILSITTDRRTEASWIVFEEASEKELVLLYGDDTTAIEVPYGDGEYLSFGRVEADAGYY